MAQIPPNKRLDYILKRLKELNIRFHVADVVAKTGLDKGNVSAVLNGKKPVSDNFWSKFSQAYGGESTILTDEQIIAELREDKSFLKKLVVDNQEIIKVNLNELLKVQKYTEAQLQASIRRAAERFAKEDKRLTDQELGKISSYVVEILGVNVQAGKDGRKS